MHSSITKQICSFELDEICKFYTKTRREKISDELLTTEGNNQKARRVMQMQSMVQLHRQQTILMN